MEKYNRFFRVGLAQLFFLIFIVSCVGQDDNEVIFADASKVWWSAAPTVVANERDFYSQNKVSVKSFDVNSGLLSKNAVVAGNADVGLVASTPLVIGASKNEDLVILGRFVSSYSLVSLLSTVDIKNSPCFKEDVLCNELANSLVTAYVPGTISEFYLRSFLEKNNKIEIFESIKENSIKIPPPNFPTSFGKGKSGKIINTAIIWEPFASDIRKPRANINHNLLISEPGESLYEMALFLITTKEKWLTKKEEIIAFVKSVRDAGKYIESNSDSVRVKMESKYGYPANWLHDRWELVNFDFETSNRIIMESLNSEADLALKSGVILSKPDMTYMLSLLDSVTKAIDN